MSEDFTEDVMFTRRPEKSSEPEICFQMDIPQLNQTPIIVENAEQDNLPPVFEAPLEHENATSNNAESLTTEANQATTTNTEDKPKRMKKGPYKRYLALIAAGVPEEEAKEKALIPPPQPTKKVKIPKGAPIKRLDPNVNLYSRRKNNESRNSNDRFTQNANSGRFQNTYTQLPSLRAVYGDNKQLINRRLHAQSQDPTQNKVAILPSNYPIDLLTNERMNEIEEQIIRKLAQQKYSLMKHEFVSRTHKIGYIVFIVRHQYTIDWLMTLFNWRAENLQVVNASTTPISNVFEALFPFSAEMSSSTVFDLIQAQNVGLFPDQWKIVSEIVTGRSLQMIIAVDNASLLALEKEKFKFYYRFSQVKLDTCLGTDQDIFMAYKRFNEPHGKTNQALYGRESYNNVNLGENSRENVFSSDLFYNRH